MVISKIVGGLGNQMFQYAAGRSLALANNCQLKLDISFYKNYGFRAYELELFNINAEIASAAEVSQLVGMQPRLAKYLHKRLGVSKSTYFPERDFSFDSQFFGIKLPIYLDGYWQSPKYFSSVADQVGGELTPIEPLAGQNLEVADQMAQVNSISIHVRRGDYLTNQATNKVHGFVGVDYYKRAIHFILREIEVPYFFVFSDDLAWAKKNLGLVENVIFVDHNTGERSYEDMRLMSLCQHHIIANSSFSWWGAWLSSKPNKVVIAPKKWFATSSNSTRDLLPTGWVTI